MRGIKARKRVEIKFDFSEKHFRPGHLTLSIFSPTTLSTSGLIDPLDSVVLTEARLIARGAVSTVERCSRMATYRTVNMWSADALDRGCRKRIPIYSVSRVANAVVPRKVDATFPPAHRRCNISLRVHPKGNSFFFLAGVINRERKHQSPYELQQDCQSRWITRKLFFFN